MTYSDKEMRAFTQVAYADFDAAKNHLSELYPDRTSFSIEELERVAREINPNINLDCLNCLSNEQKQSWSISLVHDKNSENGFYACVIETSPGQAVIAFRGSESMENIDNLINDWIRADFGLLNSTQTNQHAEIERFLGENRNLLQEYDGISLTGHSLGGNLADYATLVSYKYGFDDKIDSCVSFDGPGFSSEFIQQHLADVNRMKDVMKHYKWSLVGNLLFPLPGVYQQVCSVTDEGESKPLVRHDTKYLVYDENGNLIPGNKDALAVGMDKISKGIDGLTGPVLFNTFLIAYSFYGGVKEDIQSFFNSIADKAQSLYKNIKVLNKKIFKSKSNYFKVDIVRLERDADAIQNQIENVRKCVHDMFVSVNNLNKMWRGSASTAFSSKFAEEQVHINNYLNELAKYVMSIKNDCNAYRRCESQAMNIISSVGI